MSERRPAGNRDPDGRKIRGHQAGAGGIAMNARAALPATHTQDSIATS
jgi:hypothetical protein